MLFHFCVALILAVKNDASCGSDPSVVSPVLVIDDPMRDRSCLLLFLKLVVTVGDEAAY